MHSILREVETYAVQCQVPQVEHLVQAPQSDAPR